MAIKAETERVMRALGTRTSELIDGFTKIPGELSDGQVEVLAHYLAARTHVNLARPVVLRMMPEEALERLETMFDEARAEALARAPSVQ
jgi:hypothetical protein